MLILELAFPFVCPKDQRALRECSSALRYFFRQHATMPLYVPKGGNHWVKFVRAACPDVRRIRCHPSTVGIVDELAHIKEVEVCDKTRKFVNRDIHIKMRERPPMKTLCAWLGCQSDHVKINEDLTEIEEVDISGLLTLTCCSRYDILQTFAKRRLSNVNVVVANECAPSLLILLVTTFRKMGSRCTFVFERSVPSWKVTDLRALDCVLNGMDDEDVDEICIA